MKIELKVLNKEFYSDYDHSCSEDDCVKLCEGGYNKLPTYATPGSAAIDLVCPEDVVLYPGEVKVIHTGLAIWIGSVAKDCEQSAWWQFNHNKSSVAALIIPRSGRGAKEGLVIANTIGLIDEDYQEELIVYVMNRNPATELPDFSIKHRGVSSDQIIINKGERFAQMTFIPIIKAQFEVVEEFSGTTDRKGGHGSTGL